MTMQPLERISEEPDPDALEQTVRMHRSELPDLDIDVVDDDDERTNPHVRL